MTDTTASATTHREFTVTRIFDAPRERVFRAWTEPAEFASWWGGAGATTPTETMRMDVRPGGQWYASMRLDATGAEHPFAGVYREVVPPERLAFTLSEGDRPDPEREHLLTVALVDLDGQTEMTFTQAGDFGAQPDEMLAGLAHGYGAFFARLESVLAQETSQ
ncbi:MAG: hypothetical protein NVSMB29_04240 [Candidatus Dormibacteria bacterium]